MKPNDSTKSKLAHDLIYSIMQKVVRIEKREGRMLSEIDAELEQEVFDAIDSRGISFLHLINERLDRLAN